MTQDTDSYEGATEQPRRWPFGSPLSVLMLAFLLAGYGGFGTIYFAEHSMTLMLLSLSVVLVGVALSWFGLLGVLTSG